MALSKTTVKVTNISELATRPNATDGLTDATFKALFDKSSSDLKTYINDTLTTEVDSALGTINSTLSAKQKTITSGTAAPSGGSDGDIYIQYE